MSSLVIESKLAHICYLSIQFGYKDLINLNHIPGSAFQNETGNWQYVTHIAIALLVRVCPSRAPLSNKTKMSALNPRNRTVVFRLTREEYESLKCACAEKGGRNISEFTRSELISLLHAQPEEYLIRRKLDAIERQLTNMHADLREIRLYPMGAKQPEVPGNSSASEGQELVDIRSTK